MAKKFEATAGNYFLVSDTITGTEEIRYPSKDILFKQSGNSVKFYGIGQNNLLGLWAGYPLGATNSTGSVELTGGGAGSVDGITVNAIQIMSGAEAFATDLPTTAQNVADNINAFTSTPNYTASVVGSIVTITADVAGTGPNGFAVVSTATTITTTDTNMAGGTTDIQNSGGTPFADMAALVTFLDANTGA